MDRNARSDFVCIQRSATSMLYKRFSLLVPRDWRKRPILDHASQEQERRSEAPENRKMRMWIELADILLRRRRAKGDAALPSPTICRRDPPTLTSLDGSHVFGLQALRP